MATGPWWVIDATSGNPPQYVLTQNQSKPQPANSAFTVTGPFPTQAAAQATIPAGAKSSVQAWDSAAGTIGALGTAAGAAGIPGAGAAAGVAASATGAFTSVQNSLSGFYDVLTNHHMWASLGWLALGVALMIVGVLLWIHPSAVSIPVPI